MAPLSLPPPPVSLPLQKRQVYDAYGEEGLKSSGGPGGFPGGFGGGPGGFHYTPRAAEDIFAEIFRG